MDKSLRTCLLCRKGVMKPHHYTAQGHLFWETKQVEYTVPNVPCMMCDNCAEIMLGTDSEPPIFEYVRSKLGLLTALAIRRFMEIVEMTPKTLAEDIGCSEEDVNRWLTSDQIQSRMADKAMRMAFHLRASKKILVRAPLPDAEFSKRSRKTTHD